MKSNKALVQIALHTLKYLDKANPAILPRNFSKEKNGPYTGPVLLRQGESGTSQYIKKEKRDPLKFLPFLPL